MVSDRDPPGVLGRLWTAQLLVHMDSQRGAFDGPAERVNGRLY